MAVVQTSLDAYKSLITNNRLGINQKIILDVFKSVNGQYLSNYDLSIMLGWSINRITPRVKELRSLGKLVHCGYKTQLQTNRRVNLWCMPTDFQEFVDVSYTGGVI